MKYARNQQHGLMAFPRDGCIPIDNRKCERAIRPLAVGRRNWQFAGRVEGARAAATLRTLAESAKASGEDPGRIRWRTSRWSCSASAHCRPPGFTSLRHGRSRMKCLRIAIESARDD